MTGNFGRNLQWVTPEFNQWSGSIISVKSNAIFVQFSETFTKTLMSGRKRRMGLTTGRACTFACTEKPAVAHANHSAMTVLREGVDTLRLQGVGLIHIHDRPFQPSPHT